MQKREAHQIKQEMLCAIKERETNQIKRVNGLRKERDSRDKTGNALRNEIERERERERLTG